MRRFSVIGTRHVGQNVIRGAHCSQTINGRRTVFAHVRRHVMCDDGVRDRDGLVPAPRGRAVDTVRLEPLAVESD